MIRWPILDREPVQLPTLAGYEFALWETLLELADLRPQEWTLIGGQMVKPPLSTPTTYPTRNEAT